MVDISPVFERWSASCFAETRMGLIVHAFERSERKNDICGIRLYRVCLWGDRAGRQNEWSLVRAYP